MKLSNALFSSILATSLLLQAIPSQIYSQSSVLDSNRQNSEAYSPKGSETQNAYITRVASSLNKGEISTIDLSNNLVNVITSNLNNMNKENSFAVTMQAVAATKNNALIQQFTEDFVDISTSQLSTTELSQLITTVESAKIFVSSYNATQKDKSNILKNINKIISILNNEIDIKNINLNIDKSTESVSVNPNGSNIKFVAGKFVDNTLKTQSNDSLSWKKTLVFKVASTGGENTRAFTAAVTNTSLKLNSTDQVQIRETSKDVQAKIMKENYEWSPSKALTVESLSIVRNSSTKGLAQSNQFALLAGTMGVTAAVLAAQYYTRPVSTPFGEIKQGNPNTGGSDE